MVLAAGLELAKVGESLNYGARDLWEVPDPSFEEQVAQPQAKRQKSLSDQERMDRWYVMFMTVGGLLAFRNDGMGFVAGMLCHWTCQSTETWQVCQGWNPFRCRIVRKLQRKRRPASGEEERLISPH